jgi:hypothetical protein
MNGFATVPKVVIFYTNGSHEGFVEFCVIEVFKFWVRSQWVKEWQEPKLGDAQGTPR